MEGYRLFLLRNGRIFAAREFEAPGDPEALAHADELRSGEPAELWSLARVVGKFEPKPQT